MITAYVHWIETIWDNEVLEYEYFVNLINLKSIKQQGKIK